MNGTAVGAEAAHRMLREIGVAEHATRGTSYTETKSRSTDQPPLDSRDASCGRQASGYNSRFIFLLSS